MLLHKCMHTKISTNSLLAMYVEISFISLSKSSQFSFSLKDSKVKDML